MRKEQIQLTPEEEVIVLRRCIGAMERDINRLLKRIKLQETALLNRKAEATKYHDLGEYLLASGKMTKAEMSQYLTKKPKP